MQATGTEQAVFDLKSGQFTLPNLRLLSTNLEALDEQLLARVQQAPGFFRNTPVVIDLSPVARQGGSIDFALLVGLMRGYGMLPVAVQGGNAEHQETARFLELAILADSRGATPQPAAGVPAPGTAARASNGRLIERPVRSGQRIYAAGRDLVVLASVSSGAEVIADGNIHVYGALRGRALAGVKGNREARIFCQDLQAELLAVAGQYRVSEQLPADRLGAPAQVYLAEKRLIIEKLG